MMIVASIVEVEMAGFVQVKIEPFQGQMRMVAVPHKLQVVGSVVIGDVDLKAKPGLKNLFQQKQKTKKFKKR